MLLTDEFIEKYKTIEPPMTNIGKFVYFRTYSRFLPELNRREYWYETCRRAVEYNCSLVEGVSKTEAETLFDNMFNLKLFLSGRTLWVGGTKSSEKYPSSNYNCSFTNIEKIEDICEVFYLLMLGCGVGFKSVEEYTNKLPLFNTSIELINEPYNYKNNNIEEFTKSNVDNSNLSIIVGDSKEGWVDALRSLLTGLTNKDVKSITINYDNIRPEGEELKTFGGKASGHLPLMDVFNKISNIVKKSNGKLKTIDILDICNLLGYAVQVGGVRRSAEVCLFDKDDNDIRLAKQEIFTQGADGNFTTNNDLLHRVSSNNSILFNIKPTYNELKGIFESIKTTGEPGFINGEVAKKRFADFEGMNPCFTGDTKILTSNGYKRLDYLEGKDFNIVSKSGKVSNGKVWCSGEKPIFEINRRLFKAIRCTDNHVFMLNDGSECEAKDLKGKRLMPFLNSAYLQDLEFIKYGFLQGDGALSRLNSQEHKGLEVYIGKNDDDILDIFQLKRSDCKTDYHRFYINGYNEILSNLEFSKKQLPERVFPKTYNSWNISQKLGFLKGCYSANGSILSVGRITYKTTCRQFAEELKLALSEFNINAYITTNKSKSVKFLNGTYTCKESYDINISNYESKLNFCNAIGFIQKYKQDKLIDILIKKSPVVDSVKNTNSIERVYDFTEPFEHWGVVEGFIAHNCCEILLPSKGFCNLVEINVLSFVDNNGEINLERLLHAIMVATRASYRMSCLDIELPEWKIKQEENMLLGVSLSGWQDAMNKSRTPILEQPRLLTWLKNKAKESALDYSNILKRNCPKLITTEKPSGTLSLLPTVSPGVHFSHSPYYIRRVRINANDPLVKLCEEQGLNVVPEVGYTEDNCTTKVIEFYVKSPEGRTKENITAIDQLEVYKMFMDNYVDHNASITVTVKNDEWGSVVDWVYNNWDSFVGISFLALDGATYPLMPYESISKEVYEANYKTLNINPDLIKKYETTGESDIGTDGCESGICPIR